MFFFILLLLFIGEGFLIIIAVIFLLLLFSCSIIVHSSPSLSPCYCSSGPILVPSSIITAHLHLRQSGTYHLPPAPLISELHISHNTYYRLSVMHLLSLHFWPFSSIFFFLLPIFLSFCFSFHDFLLLFYYFLYSFLMSYSSSAFSSPLLLFPFPLSFTCYRCAGGVIPSVISIHWTTPSSSRICTASNYTRCTEQYISLHFVSISSPLSVCYLRSSTS